MKNKIISIAFVGFLSLFFVWNLLCKDEAVSQSERRKLAQFPTCNVNQVVDGSFMKAFDNYTLDQFVMRDSFRNVKANMNYKVFHMLENNDIFIQDDKIFKKEYPINEKSMNYFIRHIKNITNDFTSSNQIYYSIIPDKNYYMEDERFLNLDYETLYSQVTEEFDFPFIDLRDVLSLDDYYKTDTHWRQETLPKAVDKIGSVMNFHLEHQYEAHTIDDFYGVYYGQSALKKAPDQITYLTNDVIENSQVTYLENKNSNKVYTLEQVDSLDKYSIFLDGASSFIEIENPNADNERELVIFRDSFGSSIAPLLIEAYSKITLIDTRYISRDNYLKFIDFENQDILFLYSTLIVNNSFSLKEKAGNH